MTPTVPEALSVRALEQLGEFIGAQKKPPLVLPFLSMATQRRKAHQEVIQALQESQSELLESLIPVSTLIEQMGTRRGVLAEFAPRSPVMSKYRQLWSSITQRIQPAQKPTEESAETEGSKGKKK